MLARKLVSAVIVIVIAAGAVCTANSQAKPDVLVKQRQAAMTLQGKYFGPLVGMLRGASPYDAELVARNAKYLDVLASMPWDGFAESTQGETSRALPSVWTDQSKFRLMIEEFQGAVTGLVAASSGGREVDARMAIDNLAEACGNCHDDFRRK
jgi:cytochrome c556